MEVEPKSGNLGAITGAEWAVRIGLGRNRCRGRRMRSADTADTAMRWYERLGNARPGCVPDYFLDFVDPVHIGPPRHRPRRVGERVRATRPFSVTSGIVLWLSTRQPRRRVIQRSQGRRSLVLQASRIEAGHVPETGDHGRAD